jgi:hypothetical protein
LPTEYRRHGLDRRESERRVRALLPILLPCPRPIHFLPIGAGIVNAANLSNSQPAQILFKHPCPTGGQKVAGSNPVGPTKHKAESNRELETVTDPCERRGLSPPGRARRLASGG